MMCDSVPVEIEFRWLPWAEPIPEGWRLAEHQRPSHHHHYRRLIVRDPDTTKTPQNGSVIVAG